LTLLTFGEWGAATKARMIGNKAIGFTTTKIISIYRAVGPDEFYSIMKSGRFNVISMDFKQSNSDKILKKP
jgi:hypothetical protein